MTGGFAILLSALAGLMCTFLGALMGGGFLGGLIIGFFAVVLTLGACIMSRISLLEEKLMLIMKLKSGEEKPSEDTADASEDTADAAEDTKADDAQA